jgi:hypothetical protein
MDHCQHEKRAGPKNSDPPTAALERVGLTARIRTGMRTLVVMAMEEDLEDRFREAGEKKLSSLDAQIQRYFTGKGYLNPSLQNSHFVNIIIASLRTISRPKMFPNRKEICSGMDHC